MQLEAPTSFSKMPHLSSFFFLPGVLCQLFGPHVYIIIIIKEITPTLLQAKTFDSFFGD